jgi:hypothetical protein
MLKDLSQYFHIGKYLPIKIIKITLYDYISYPTDDSQWMNYELKIPIKLQKYRKYKLQIQVKSNLWVEKIFSTWIKKLYKISLEERR